MTAVLCTPLRIERAALRRAGRSMRVVHTGMGPRRAAATARALSRGTDPVLVAGVGGGLAPQVRPGDVVVADEVRGRGAPVPIRSAPLLAGALRRLGLTVHVGPIVSSPRIAAGRARRALAVDGALAVDMESAELAVVAGVPFAVVRAIVDSVDHPLHHPGTPGRGLVALRTLRASVPALEQWAAATGPREVVPAEEADVVLVVSAPSASHSRLVELTERAGVPVHRVSTVDDIDLHWLADAASVGLIAGPDLVDEVVDCLAGLGPVTAREPRLIDEDLTFALTQEVI